MASTSASNPDVVGERIRTAASTLHADNESLITEIGKALIMMKEIAVDLERAKEFQKVKDIENAVADLLRTSEECALYSSAIQSVGYAYQPTNQRTNFKKLLEEESAKLKGTSSAPENHPFMRQFREAIWKVHHAGQPMPGEEQEDVVMTSTQCNLLNITCPLSGKPVIELADPVRSVECQHVYDKRAVMGYTKSKGGGAPCPVAGCPKMLVAEKLIRDPLLRIDIEELRSTSRQNVGTEVIEDFTD